MGSSSVIKLRVGARSPTTALADPDSDLSAPRSIMIAVGLSAVIYAVIGIVAYVLI
jgi:hypothetical protein